MAPRGPPRSHFSELAIQSSAAIKPGNPHLGPRTLEEPINNPRRRPSTVKARVAALPDILEPRLSIVFCGINPGMRSASARPALRQSFRIDSSGCHARRLPSLQIHRSTIWRDGILTNSSMGRALLSFGFNDVGRFGLLTPIACLDRHNTIFPRMQ
jgi:hypothetical protein